MKAVNGSGIRAFGFGEGENVIIEGDPADFAARLDNAEEVSQKKFTIVQNFTNPGEQTVMDIAGKWSVDPSMLSDRNDLEPGLGILAKSDFLLK
jgi:hypothetical protein